jgi:hypothetical protein
MKEWYCRNPIREEEILSANQYQIFWRVHILSTSIRIVSEMAHAVNKSGTDCPAFFSRNRKRSYDRRDSNFFYRIEKESHSKLVVNILHTFTFFHLFHQCCISGTITDAHQLEKDSIFSAFSEKTIDVINRFGHSMYGNRLPWKCLWPIIRSH